MRRSVEVVTLVLSDVLSSLLAMAAALCMKYAATAEGVAYAPQFYLLPALLLGLAWVGILAYVGLYGEWSARSRIDEKVWLTKAILVGAIILFILTFNPERPLPPSRVVLVTYGATLLGLSSLGRALVRVVQRRLFARGLNLHGALVVGTGAPARELGSTITRSPRLGYRLVGHVAVRNGAEGGEAGPTLGSLEELPELVERHRVYSVMFAEPSLSHEDALRMVAACDHLKVDFSVVPDLYDVITGTSSGLGELYGVPVMPLFPDRMPVWQRRTKRLMDIAISLTGLVVGFPLWLCVGLAIWLEDRGPLLYSQERMGRRGRIIRVHKFRSMIPDAERRSGPVWAQRNDRRITRVGAVIRKLRLDEVPQLWDVLTGEMSMVGPRPERPFFVQKLAKEIPLYRFRLHVTPGMTGWAQTKQAYDTSIDDVREKLKSDLYYIEHMSLRFDIPILLRTIMVVLTGKGAR